MRAKVHACLRVCVHVHACMRACVHASTWFCAHACCVHACRRAHVHTCIRACVHACVCAYKPACKRACVHPMGACVHVSLRTCVHGCTYSFATTSSPSRDWKKFGKIRELDDIEMIDDIKIGSRNVTSQSETAITSYSETFASTKTPSYVHAPH